MRRIAVGFVVVAAFWACGGQTSSGPGDAGSEGGSSSGGSSSGGSSSGGSSSGGSSSGSSSGGSGSGSSSGSSSGGPAPANHRPNDQACLGTPPAGSCSFGGQGFPGMCSDDAACADAGVNGRCMNDQGGPAGCYCTADTCADDNGCPTGQTCACHGAPYGNEGNHCVPGDCRVDTDCGAGGWCSPSYQPSGCGQLGGYYCHTPKDACTNDSDCSGGSQGPQLCGYDTAAGYWRCMQELLCG